MAQESAYLAAMLPTPAQVLGVRLHPFCLSHALVLQRLGNPFYCGGEASLGEQLLAVSVCAEHPARVMTSVTSPAFAWRMKLRGWWWLLRFNPTQRMLARKPLYNHIAAALEMPHFWVEVKPKAGTPDSGTPFLMRLQIVLARYYTRAEMLVTPMQEALWMYCAHYENEEALRLANEAEEEAIQAQMAQRREEAKAA